MDSRLHATYDFASSMTLSRLCSFSNWLRGHCLDFVAGSPSEWWRMQHWSAVTGGSNLRPVITGLLWIFVKKCFGFPLGVVSSVRVLPQRRLIFTLSNCRLQDLQSNVFEVAQVLLCILAGDPHGCKKYWEHAAQVKIPCCKCILKTALWRLVVIRYYVKDALSSHHFTILEQSFCIFTFCFLKFCPRPVAIGLPEWWSWFSAVVCFQLALDRSTETFESVACLWWDKGCA